MGTPTNHHLKIADTPTDDSPTDDGDASFPAATKGANPDVSSGSDSPAVIASTPPAPIKSTRPSSLSPSRTDPKRRGRRGGVQRLTSAEIDDEIDRVNCMNRGLTIAGDTDPAD